MIGLFSEPGNSATLRISEEDPVKIHPVKKFQSVCYKICKKYRAHLGRVLVSLFLLGYTIYLAFSIAHSFRLAVPLIVITSIVLFFICYNLVKKYLGERIWRSCLLPINQLVDRNWYWLQWVLAALFVIGVILYLALVVVRELRQLQSLSGFVVFLFIPWITSKHPRGIKWRPVMWGIALQFMMGILVLRWNPGYQALSFVSEEVNKFLSYSMEGAAFVFGDPFFIFHPLAFLVCPLVIYLGAVLAIMYYLGITQLIASKTGWLMQITMKISAIESVSLIANIFLSVIDTMLLLRQYIPRLTMSEFHTFLVGSHSTIAGFAFGLFVAFGVSPQHLLSGAIMSAPAAVAMAKLNWPEVEESCLVDPKDVKMERGPEANVVEAAFEGAMVAAKGVVSIMLQIIAFVSIYVFINTTIAWLGARVGINLSLEIILSYIFVPLAFLMGVEWAEARQVSSLLGVKVMFNEVLAYLYLGDQVRNREISDRSATIATYAMCGFSSIGTLLIFVGVWDTVDRKRVKQVAGQLPRVFMNANCSCFLTACIAGLFYNADLARPPPASDGILNLLDLIPGYREIFNAVFTNS